MQLSQQQGKVRVTPAASQILLQSFGLICVACLKAPAPLPRIGDARGGRDVMGVPEARTCILEKQQQWV